MEGTTWRCMNRERLCGLDYFTRMEGTTGKDMNDLYTRMIGAQQ
jgi:hypothetical protein